DEDFHLMLKIDAQVILYDKMSYQLVEMNNNVLKLQENISEKQTTISELEECVCKKDLEIEKCLERLNDYENKLYKAGQTRQTIYMIMPSKDEMYNGRKGIGFDNQSYFYKAKELRPSLYDEKVIGLEYTLMFLTHSDEALEIEKFKRARENKIEFAYDYGNLNEKINFSDDYFQEIINPYFKKIDSPVQQTSLLKPYIPTVILEKIIINLEDEVVSLLKKEKEHLEIIESLKSKDLGTHISVRRPESRSVIWQKKGSSNALCVDLSSLRTSNLNKDVKRYSRKDLLYDSYDTNDVYVLDDVNINCPDFSLDSRLGMFNAYDRKFTMFRVGQFCDKGLEVAFRKSTCFVRAEEGVDLLTGDRSSNLYTISLNDITSNSSVCLLAKASSQSWLWHQRLSHLNFATINNLVKNNLVRGLPKMKFEKDHLCSTCEQGKIHRIHHKSKNSFASNKPLYLLHMDLCGLIRVESINGKRYVLVVVDDYLWYTWALFLRTKDDASKVIISFIKKTQVNLQLQVQHVRTDNGIEFNNKTLVEFFDKVGITQQFFVARTPQQNGVVEWRNHTLVEATRTMLTFKNLPLFLWAEAITTACFIQNRSIIHKRFDKTPYELINKRKPNIKFFHVFGYRCYILNDYDDVGKLKAKGDIGVFVGYSKESAAFRVYNKRTRKIYESVNVSQVSETSKKDLEDLFHNFYDEYFGNSKITKSPITNVETSNEEISSSEEELFHEISESFPEESSSSSLNDDVQQRSEEVMVPLSNTQFLTNDIVPNVDEECTSHNVFNE
ncbi:retrovirus-related pol polyprotein from transposon TNT 1-94, partial [Tanacetum coccineum]